MEAKTQRNRIHNSMVERRDVKSHPEQLNAKSVSLACDKFFKSRNMTPDPTSMKYRDNYDND